MIKKKGGLNRGLDAFINDKKSVEDIIKPIKDGEILNLDLKDIKTNDSQPRKSFEEDKLKDLAASIKEHGVIQPIIVRKLGEDYEIVAGERRYRASLLSEMKSIPAIVKDLDDFERENLALIENVQREDLNPFEEAVAYKNLIDRYNLTQDELAKGIGKSRPYISNTVRLLRLDDRVLEFLKEGKISYSIARELLSINNPDEQYMRAKEIIESGLTVKEVAKSKKRRRNTKKAETNIYLSDVEDKFMSSLGTKVKIDDDKKVISINYYDNEDLQRIIEIIVGE